MKIGSPTGPNTASGFHMVGFFQDALEQGVLAIQPPLPLNAKGEADASGAGSEEGTGLSRSSHRHKASFRLRELSALPVGRGRFLLLRGFISMLMRLRRWAQLFSSKNSISPFLAL